MSLEFSCPIAESPVHHKYFWKGTFQSSVVLWLIKIHFINLECYHAKKNKNIGEPSALMGNIPFSHGQSWMLTQKVNPRRKLNLAFLACGVIIFGSCSSIWQGPSNSPKAFCNDSEQCWMYSLPWFELIHVCHRLSSKE